MADQALGRPEQVVEADAEADLLDDLVGVFRVDVVLDGRDALLTKVVGRDLHEICDFCLFVSSWVSGGAGFEEWRAWRGARSGSLGELLAGEGTYEDEHAGASYGMARMTVGGSVGIVEFSGLCPAMLCAGDESRAVVLGLGGRNSQWTSGRIRPRQWGRPRVPH